MSRQQKHKDRREWNELQEKCKKEQLNLSIQSKLQKAEELKRQQILKKIAKAHDEESKVNEILFIQKKDAEFKRLDILDKEKDSEKRLQEIEDERLRKLEEKAARELAVEERRKIIEAEYQKKLNRIRLRREEKDKKIELQMIEKEKERLELVNQKARERELRLFAKEAAHQANVEELQKKIQLKQEESKRRHEENIEQIRARAFELSVRRGSSLAGTDDAPASSPYRVKKMCSLCNLMIGSEVYLYSHLRSKKHQEAIQGLLDGVEPSKDQLELYNLKYIVDAVNISDPNSNIKLDKETLKAISKTRKKLRQRLLQKGKNFEKEWRNNSNETASNMHSSHRVSTSKILAKIKSLINDNPPKQQWPRDVVLTLDRSINQLNKFSSDEVKDLIYLYQCDVLPVLVSILLPLLDVLKDKLPPLPEKTYINIFKLLENICSNQPEICYYLLSSTLITSLLDILAHRLNLSNEESAIMTSSFTSSSATIHDPLCSSLSQLLASITRTVCDSNQSPFDKTEENYRQRVTDMISYTISIGIVDKLALSIANSQGLVCNDIDLAEFIRNNLTFITFLTKLLASIRDFDDLFSPEEPEDATQFIITIRMTQMAGVIPLIYGSLLNTGSSLRPHSIPQESPQHVLKMAFESLRLLNYFALVDLRMLQTILGSEGLSLQFRHIVDYLIRYSNHYNTTDLLHEVILLVGYFTVANEDNQAIIQSGSKPTILEQLCLFPFEYFSECKLSKILLPTLISCCYKNKENRLILEQEVSPSILSTFIEETLIDSQVKQINFQGIVLMIDVDGRWDLAVRFPKNQWLQAIKYFSL